ncbi:short chain dehydrogenase/reductase family protein-like protein [Lineolata rhizophorae]|uniref:Short chain dehydrogenase/reductase family protein-like protein n=1 Tax=Lineolata rhizophorae TaxID=578093 RepID=A0A6A6NZM7_9PEZI|nr:short chain dehydrogenase/reductase family protein-like protein [Lineolata rhizophorae]
MDRDVTSSLSPTSVSRNPDLRLPATCDPPSEHNPPQQAVWIVFGATGHMGRSLVRAALSHGDKVTAVGWTQENTMEQMTKLHDPSGYLGLLCDVRIKETVDQIMKESIDRWGHVDIIAKYMSFELFLLLKCTYKRDYSCTGYGVIAACEDQDDHDVRAQFETNFFGTMHILSCSLPYFRSRSHGRYLIFSSTSGALGVPGLGPYCATKYAVEGLIESMQYEVEVFNIKATLVEPGHVRLDEPDSKEQGLKKYGHFWVKQGSSEPYGSAHAPAGHAKRMVQWLNDRQPTSAVKSAELVWQLGHCAYPPLRLLLGAFAVDSIRDRLKSIIEEIEDWKHLSFPASTDEQEPDPDRDQDQDQDPEHDTAGEEQEGEGE